MTTLRALVYYVSTTLIAVIIGVLIVTIMKPGVGRGESINSHISSDISQAKTISTVDTVLDLFR
jgi:Na+/H+-dicarboxylate symporter